MRGLKPPYSTPATRTPSLGTPASLRIEFFRSLFQPLEAQKLQKAVGKANWKRRLWRWIVAIRAIFKAFRAESGPFWGLFRLGFVGRVLGVLLLMSYV
jgi:hypothetical protein